MTCPGQSDERGNGVRDLSVVTGLPARVFPEFGPELGTEQTTIGTGQSELLSVCVSVDYPGKPDILRQVVFSMQPGEVLGLVGQSGSGKSTLALTVLGLLGLKGGVAKGQVWFRGRDLMRLKEREMRRVRGREIGLVLQSPLSSLNPALRIGTQLDEAWKAHRNGSRQERKQAFLELLGKLSLPAEESFLRRFPRQLSVGQAQRMLIAQAILHRPALLIADEPTSALDVITQSEIIQLFGRLNSELNMGLLYISHDLLSVASLCHRVAILHEGQIVECRARDQIFRNPQHPYTRRLIEALPKTAL
ncbi:MAG TPA: ABC transporter ATP-binding protein [Terriglobia bacterium]|nr:ABC transporter ATP-binding protein [Terriglobia bacterium]